MELPELVYPPCPHNPGVCECDLVGMEDTCSIKPTLAEWLAEYGTLAQRERQLLEAFEENQRLRELIANVPWPPYGEDECRQPHCIFSNWGYGKHSDNCPVAAFEAERAKIKGGK